MMRGLFKFGVGVANSEEVDSSQFILKRGS